MLAKELQTLACSLHCAALQNLFQELMPHPETQSHCRYTVRWVARIKPATRVCDGWQVLLLDSGRWKHVWSVLCWLDTALLATSPSATHTHRHTLCTWFCSRGTTAGFQPSRLFKGDDHVTALPCLGWLGRAGATGFWALSPGHVGGKSHCHEK